jgi:hypothetical protein
LIVHSQTWPFDSIGGANICGAGVGEANVGEVNADEANAGEANAGEAGVWICAAASVCAGAGAVVASGNV